tara:strand:- start:139 stop:330 length:192 start_codon:yes stop_codon:yes gene_type:complete
MLMNDAGEIGAALTHPDIGDISAYFWFLVVALKSWFRWLGATVKLCTLSGVRLNLGLLIVTEN